MREPVRDIDRLRHIGECIDHINDYLRGKTFEEMKADNMCFHAVVYNLMVLGEAANLLTKEFRSEHPDVPWRDIVDMRNLLIHGYIVTNPTFVWETYRNDLPTLKRQVEQYMEELSNGEQE
ncbi:MAG: DUF86 domain-containing protein [Bacteroidaceae bacterium]|nr:DUF86 domain-containing protein [Bacteroidaceae bacterium]